MNVSATNTTNIARTAPAWYLVHCKPRQDESAEENLLRQGHTCYQPQHSCERIVRGRRQIIAESLFPGYLFIQLTADAYWAALRSTRGVSRIVSFGGIPLRFNNSLITHLQLCAAAPVNPALEAGDSVRLTEDGFAERDAIFVDMDGEQRVLLLLNILNRQQQISMPLMSIARTEYASALAESKATHMVKPVKFEDCDVLKKPTVNSKAAACLISHCI